MVAYKLCPLIIWLLDMAGSGRSSKSVEISDAHDEESEVFLTLSAKTVEIK